MDRDRKKELTTFIIVLAVIAVTFIYGVVFLREGSTTDASNLIALAAGLLTPSSTTSTTMPTLILSPLAVSTSTTSTLDISPKVSVPVTSATTPAPAVTTTDVVIPAPTPVATTTSPSATTIKATTTIVTALASNTTTTKTLPYSIGTFGTQFAKDDGWATWWGSAAQNNGVLTMGATTNTTGGGALLKGSDGWTNYTFQAILDWKSGRTFDLVARYMNSQNYVECEFEEDSIGRINLNLLQYVNGKSIDLANGVVQNYNEFGGANLTTEIQVNGNQAACGFNNNAISTAVAGDALTATSSPNGEIGFNTWDPAKNNSQITVKSVGVVNMIYYLGPNTDQGSDVIIQKDN